MTHTQTPGCSYSLTIIAHKEAKWAAALFETAFLERSELKHPCNRQGCGSNQPGVEGQPGPTVYEPVNLCVTQEGSTSQSRSDERISCQKGGLECYRMALLPTCV